MNTCLTGKRRYRNRLDARIALANTRRRDRGEKRAYQCPGCHGWHLTSKPA
ncbi:hypothetical protein ACIQH0_37810 [Streptomyces griseus]|uniref:hypothetical protein n=2 Tax=Streptomyces TaxID=1883 RepID=UPI0037F15D0E